MGKKRLFATLVLLSTGLMGGTFAWANDSKELKSVKSQISSQQQDVQQHKKQLSQLQQQLANDEKAISNQARQLNQTQQQLKTNESALAQLDAEHTRLNKQAEQQKQLLAEQVRASYQNGRHDYLKLLLNGQDSTEIDRLLHYYAHLNQVRAEALQQLALTAKQLAENRRQAEQSRNQLNELLAQQQSEQEKLKSQQSKRSDTAKQLNSTLDKSNQRLASLQQSANNLEQQIKAAIAKAAREQAARERAEREARAKAEREAKARAEREAREYQARVEREEREYQARVKRDQAAGREPSRPNEVPPPPPARKPIVAKTSGNFAGLRKGTLPWPLKGQLVHRFGGARTSQLAWKGVLIGAPIGREVTSIASGQVVYADWLSGFGMVMVIDHGKGYMSLYGHNQSLLRNPGDKVAAGQPIALSGESGGQEQSGLYFEIRYQGSAVDPLPWLKS
ncbi:peptidoglycan DD-metalloendopeptidase family protein [Oceanisphaera sp. IT1-181]|uniref:peptidoglycan DD-metalloendopeptidase family protein n=1 Tax=Oceanisphaera sp. IT1-181 TaxID=3081199 RepID=UPI0029C9CA0B|nr:peptidoglycan DD-metalloendopeptidase family protein [Oceanisphaera sp. IT1-181]